MLKRRAVFSIYQEYHTHFMSATRLIVVRHGETTYNIEGRFTGVSDAPLTELGKQQAERVGAYLARERIDAIVASDLQRARDTAQAIARYHNLPVLEDPDLREISMGDWEGLRFAEIREHNPEVARQVRADPSRYAPPNGETLEQLRLRIISALERWTALYPDGTVVWVSHGGTISVLLCHLMDLDLNRRRQFRHHNASIHEVLIGENYPVFVHLNEIAHLRDMTRAEDKRDDLRGIEQ